MFKESFRKLKKDIETVNGDPIKYINSFISTLHNNSEEDFEVIFLISGTDLFYNENISENPFQSIVYSYNSKRNVYKLGYYGDKNLTVKTRILDYTGIDAKNEAMKLSGFFNTMNIASARISVFEDKFGLAYVDVDVSQLQGYQNYHSILNLLHSDIALVGADHPTCERLSDMIWKVIKDNQIVPSFIKHDQDNFEIFYQLLIDYCYHPKIYGKRVLGSIGNDLEEMKRVHDQNSRGQPKAKRQRKQ